MGFKLNFDKTDLISIVILAVGTSLFLTNPFQKSDTDNKEGGHEYVDLGLSVKWATENLGRCESAPYGSFYSWGVHELPDAYTQKYYKYTLNLYLDPSLPYTVFKYCTDSIYGEVDNLVCVESADDAVVRTWGEGWRTPTESELNELVSKCKWTVYELNGIKGMKVIGPNGNHIFLPMLGYNKAAYEHAPYGSNVYGCYWSSSLDAKNSLSASCLYFANKSYKVKSMYRYLGFAIRPVIDK